MNRIFKVSIISLALLLGFSLGIKANAADCGVCKFGSGACTIDLRPGEGDGTLCNCSNGGKCEKKTDDTCGCTKLEDVVKSATNNNEEPTPVSTTSNNSVVPTNTNGNVKTVSSSESENNTVSYVLIGIGALVLVGGIFGIVKIAKAKK